MAAAVECRESNHCKIEMCIKRLRNSSFVVAHYFIRIPSLDLEIHPGMYEKGNFLNLNSTKHYKVLTGTCVCNDCLNRLLETSKSLLHAWYYPLINCETLTKGLCLGRAMSVQSIVAVSFLAGVSLLYAKFELFIATFLALCLLVLVVLALQYNTWQNGHYHCEHIS